MRVAIHQPHYFPWMGYFDKMAKVDKFIIMDEVQLVQRSPMIRNKFLSNLGDEITLSLSVDKKGYLEKMTKDIELIEWDKIRKKHSETLKQNYSKSVFFKEIWNEIEEIFNKDYIKLIDLEMEIINKLKQLLDIKTEIIYQSNLVYNKEKKKSDLILELCLASKADIYLSGNGGKKYMKLDDYKEKNIKVIFQKFEYPEYKQLNTETFIPKLSILDLLFNCGIEKSREIFWNNVRRSND